VRRCGCGSPTSKLLLLLLLEAGRSSRDTRSETRLGVPLASLGRRGRLFTEEAMWARALRSTWRGGPQVTWGPKPLFPFYGESRGWRGPSKRTPGGTSGHGHLVTVWGSIPCFFFAVVGQHTHWAPGRSVLPHWGCTVTRLWDGRPFFFLCWKDVVAYLCPRSSSSLRMSTLHGGPLSLAHACVFLFANKAPPPPPPPPPSLGAGGAPWKAEL